MYQIYPNLLFTEIKSRCSGPVAPGMSCQAPGIGLGGLGARPGGVSTSLRESNMAGKSPN